MLQALIAIPSGAEDDPVLLLLLPLSGREIRTRQRPGNPFFSAAQIIFPVLARP